MPQQHDPPITRRSLGLRLQRPPTANRKVALLSSAATFLHEQLLQSVGDQLSNVITSAALPSMGQNHMILMRSFPWKTARVFEGLQQPQN